ncbi:MAG: sulfur carrier protein ThiS [Solirubrobacterales bacterium]|nr:sulfur carrier protein ThiS [Solirubrobacterales bacterium]
MTIEVTVNGDARELAEGTTVEQLVEQLGGGDRGVAVAVDATVVPRGAWETTTIPDGAQVEVLVAVQGG